MVETVWDIRNNRGESTYLQQPYDVSAANTTDADAVSCAPRRGSPRIEIEKNIGADEGATWLEATAARGERDGGGCRLGLRKEVAVRSGAATAEIRVGTWIRRPPLYLYLSAQRPTCLVLSPRPNSPVKRSIAEGNKKVKINKDNRTLLNWVPLRLASGRTASRRCRAGLTG